MPHTPPILEEALAKADYVAMRYQRFHEMGDRAKPAPLDWEEVEALKVLIRLGYDLMSLRSVLT